MLKKKTTLFLICILTFLNLALYFKSSTRQDREKLDVIIKNYVKTENDVTIENYVKTENDVMIENDVKTENGTKIKKLYPDWIVAKFSRESPFSRTLSRQNPPHSAWTPKEGKSPLGSVWPQPQKQQNDENKLIGLSLGSMEFIYYPKSLECEIVNSAMRRYKNIIFNEFSSTEKPFISKSTDLSKVEIFMTGNDCEELPHLDMDESYKIVANQQKIYIESKSVWGIIRGLETFSQLIWRTSNGEIVLYETKIDDFPRFKHRGLLIDTARHFLPKNIILKNLDAMAYNKMNVLHWHLVDDQSFSYLNKDFPELAYMGSYDPFKLVYSEDDVKEIVDYASLRGIRVIPEFDTPGHTLSWGKSHPELLTHCERKDKPDWGPFNPARETTFEFMEKFLASVRGDFPDNNIHIGGDEVDISCWSINKEIQEYMKKHKIASTKDLANFYMSKMFSISEILNFRPIVWHETFKLGLQGHENAIVQVWDQMHPHQTLKEMTSRGHDVIVSHPWYLDLWRYGGSWAKLYEREPLNFNPSNDEKINSKVLGGEACMWAEYFDEHNFLQNAWPRTSAVAERLWSDRKVNDAKKASERIYKQTCRMIRRGIPANPTSSGFCSDL